MSGLFISIKKPANNMQDDHSPSFKNLKLVSPAFISDLDGEKLHIITFEGIDLYFVKDEGAQYWNRLVGSDRMGIKWVIERELMTSLEVTDGKLWVHGIDDKTTHWHICLDRQTGTILEQFIK